MIFRSKTPTSGDASLQSELQSDEERTEAMVEKSAKQAVVEALDQHRRMGRRVPVMRGGKVVWLEPEQIGELIANIDAVE